MLNSSLDTHAADDVICCHGNVLHTCSAVVVKKLLNLAATTSGRRLSDGHNDRFIVVRNYDRSHGGGFHAYNFVVRHFGVRQPVTMKHQHPLVPIISRI